MAEFEKIPTETEPSPEQLPEKFEAVIVVGEFWRDNPNKQKLGTWEPVLNIESKMSALAAAEMVKAGLADKIIISAGATAGPEQPSEAGAMLEFMVKNCPEIVGKTVILENESIDTAENAENVLPILEKYNLHNVALMAMGSHLPRTKKLFEAYGISAKAFPSEEFLVKRSPHYERFVQKYLHSPRMLSRLTREAILRSLLVVDTKGKMLQKLTKTIRG